jgi:hypothetical protein
MGLFDKLLGKKEDFPPLPSDHPSMARLEKDMKGLETLTREVSDRLEVVPAERASYVFIGKPPKVFGLVWVEGAEVKDFKLLGKEKGLTSLDLKPVTEKVKTAYENNPPSERFSMEIGGRSIVIAPASGLAGEVENVIQAAAS